MSWHVLSVRVAVCFCPPVRPRLGMPVNPGAFISVCVCLPITDHRSSTDDLSWITHPDHPPIIDPPIILRSSIIDHLSPTDHRFTDHHITTPTYVAPELSRHMTMVYIYIYIAKVCLFENNKHRASPGVEADFPFSVASGLEPLRSNRFYIFGCSSFLCPFSSYGILETRTSVSCVHIRHRLSFFVNAKNCLFTY